MVDTKLTGLGIITVASGNYLIYIVSDPSGTPLEKGITVDNLFAGRGISQVPLAIFFPPGEPPASGFATFDTRNQHPVMDFDAASDESTMWTGILGKHYNNNGITVTLHITDTADTNSAHASYWNVYFERLTAQDIDTDSFASGIGNHVHPNGTSGIPVTCTVIFEDGEQIDNLNGGDLFRIKIARDASNASDDWTGDAELLGVELMETV